MNIFDKIDIVSIHMEDLHETLMDAHEKCNEQGIDSQTQISRYTKIEEIESKINVLKEIRVNLLKEAGISID